VGGGGTGGGPQEGFFREKNLGGEKGGKKFVHLVGLKGGGGKRLGGGRRGGGNVFFLGWDLVGLVRGGRFPRGGGGFIGSEAPPLFIGLKV